MSLVRLVNKLRRNRLNTIIARELNLVRGFQTQSFMLSGDLKTAIAIDKSYQRLCLLTIESERVKKQTIHYSDILSAHINVNGQRKGQIKRESVSSVVKQRNGLINAQLLLANGLGMAVAGEGMIAVEKSLTFALSINNSQHPTFVCQSGGHLNKAQSKQTINQYQRWLEVLAELLSRADEKEALKNKALIELELLAA